MQKAAFGEIRLKLPSDVIETISTKEIVALLLDKALSKKEYYWSKCREFAEKYNMDFTAFKKRVEESEEEVFTEWDDLMIWEGNELGYKEWERKYEGLRACME